MMFIKPMSLCQENPDVILHFMLLVKNEIYFLSVIYFYINSLQEYLIQINVINKLGQK